MMQRAAAALLGRAVAPAFGRGVTRRGSQAALAPITRVVAALTQAQASCSGEYLARGGGGAPRRVAPSSRVVASIAASLYTPRAQVRAECVGRGGGGRRARLPIARPRQPVALRLQSLVAAVRAWAAEASERVRPRSDAARRRVAGLPPRRRRDSGFGLRTCATGRSCNGGSRAAWSDLSAAGHRTAGCTAPFGSGRPSARVTPIAAASGGAPCIVLPVAPATCGRLAAAEDRRPRSDEPREMVLAHTGAWPAVGDAGGDARAAGGDSARQPRRSPLAQRRARFCVAAVGDARRSGDCRRGGDQERLRFALTRHARARGRAVAAGRAAARERAGGGGTMDADSGGGGAAGGGDASSNRCAAAALARPLGGRRPRRRPRPLAGGGSGAFARRVCCGALARRQSGDRRRYLAPAGGFTLAERGDGSAPQRGGARGRPAGRRRPPRASPSAGPARAASPAPSPRRSSP